MTYFRNFNEFHANMTKRMPDAVLYPDMYNLCYDLMKLTWDAARAEQNDKEKIIRSWHDYAG